MLVFAGSAAAQPPSVSAPILAWRPVAPHGGFAAYIPVSTPTPTVIVEQRAPTAGPSRPVVPVPTSPVIEVGPTKTTAVSRSLTGLASWYCKAGVSICHYRYPPGSMVAAACGKLRAAMGPNWRGKTVTVQGPRSSVRVQLVDWCGSASKTIDLYWEPMRRLGGTGVLPVTIRW